MSSRPRVASHQRPRRSHLLASLALAWLLAAHIACAAECGDHVDGVRVACACGDTVVADTVLRPSDPVVSGRCALDGLVVRARDLAETITLDLDGLALVGSGVGVGIRVEHGGSEGAAILGGRDGVYGEVVGFNIGILVGKAYTVRRIESVRLKGHRREGLELETAGTMVLRVHAERNGGDGIRLHGRGGRLLQAVSVENAGAGIRANGTDLIIEASATRNTGHGIISSGQRNDLGNSVASDNKGFGVVVTGFGHRIENVTSHGNSAGAIAKRSGGLR